MTFEWISRVLISPVFFFLSIVLIGLCLISLYAAFVIKPSFLVVGAVLFIFGFNCFRVGWKVFVNRQF